MPGATPTPRRAGPLWLGSLLLGAARLAFSQTDEIQVYDAAITAPGSFNLTWHDNFTPAGRAQPAFAGGIVPDHALNGVPEWAYGLTDWFETGLYLPVYTRAADGSWLFDGMKLRALFVAPDAATRSFFYGVNFELSYDTSHWDPSRYAGEIRPIVGWHLGRCDLIVNPILDSQFDGFSKLDFAPAVRAAWHLGGKVAVALEEYSDLGPLRHFRAASDQQHTLFAVFDYGSGSSGLELGIGKGLTRASDSTVLKLMLMHDL
ncbi:MAG TPA: hypothetical protein VKT54_02835 [Steroidobacteraceae bacterium]|nr:hypothetical protein [Steroidobacteraceae bacterium]